ncbi:phosphoribosylglycinamide formyltransferase [Saccharospirillum alexandrii]|uniref:phosphoribosylglycinamide formyltransferase n=1 Tax=Saccharospirillum alexandrii TaxID=2448477 RepID=UPI003736AF0D
MTRIVVLISGGGSNLQSLLDQCQTDSMDANIVAVISNRPDAFGLSRARQAGVKALTLDHTGYADRAAFDAALAELIEAQKPDLIVLAGFMRILTDDFVRRFPGKMINIHPSLLPRYPGLNTHQRALDAGDSKAGATVHFVTAELDGGPPIAQVEVPISDQDDADSLARKVLVQEHRLYPTVVDWFVKGRLRLDASQVLLDEQPLPKSGRLLDTASL